MSDTKRCDACVNYRATGKDFMFRADKPGADGHPMGECRIGPPQPSGDLRGPRWPLVFADDWCGCFIRREEEPAVLPFPADRVGPAPVGAGPLDGPPATVLPFAGVARSYSPRVASDQTSALQDRDHS